MIAGGTKPHIWARIDKADPASHVVPLCAPDSEPVPQNLVVIRKGCPECDAEVAVANARRWAREQGERIRRDKALRGEVRPRKKPVA